MLRRERHSPRRRPTPSASSHANQWTCTLAKSRTVGASRIRNACGLTPKVGSLIPSIVSYRVAMSVAHVGIKKIAHGRLIRSQSPPIKNRHCLIRYRPSTTLCTAGTTMDDIHTNPIFGEEHHNQARSFRALADNNRPIRFGVTDIKPRQKTRQLFRSTHMLSESE